jgi:hypothetical protein
MLNLRSFLPIVAFVPATVFSQGFVDVAADHNMIFLETGDNYGSGISFRDFNHDGWDDITFGRSQGQQNFYRNVGGSFTLQDYGIVGAGQTRSILWADYDNDGDDDLVLTTYLGICKLFRNNGGLQFVDHTAQAGLLQLPQKTYGASWGDYDRDGWLDLYVCNYEFEGDSTDQNLWNHLYRNNGDGTFSDVTVAAGVGDGIKFSFQAMWMDYNTDGWQDLFIINDRWHPNSLYRNNGDGTFTNVADSVNVSMTLDDPMSISMADMDNDQDMDIFYTNTGVLDRYCRLLENDGSGNFTETALDHGISILAWTWGAAWVDIINNSHLDLYVTSAFPGSSAAYSNFLFGNVGDGQFVNALSLMQGENTARSFSPVCGDFDNDGFTDIAVQNQAPYRPYLWRNLGGPNHYVKITPRGTVSNRDAVGSWVKVHFDGETRVKYTVCGENYLGQSSQHLIFGLGDATLVDSVEITYLSGHRDVYYDLVVDSSYSFVEGETFIATIQPSSSQTICPGTTIVLDAGDHSSWLWNTGHTGRFLTVTAAGEYSVTVTNEFGITAESGTVVVYDELEMTTEVSNATSGEDNGSIQLTPEGGAAPYSITLNGSPVNTLIQDLAAGSYTIAVTDANGCTITSNVTISISVGLTSTKEEEISIWPNPVSGSLHYSSDASIERIFVLDTEGRELMGQAGSFSGSIDISSLAPGAYLVRLITAEREHFHRRIMKL